MDSPRTLSSWALAPLFLLSGISGLAYEIVWFRMLIRVFGVTVYAVSTILVVYMLGLALGSFIAGKRVAGKSNLLRIYAIVEISIGLSALLSTMLMSKLPAIFQSAVAGIGDAPAAIIALRVLLAAIVLVVPTLLMGATLPILSGVIATREDGVSKHVGVLYGINTLGAVLGVAGAGFFSIMLAGELGTVWLGALLNGVVAIGAWVLASRMRADGSAVGSADGSAAGSTDTQREPAAAVSRRVLAVLAIYAVSGFCALAFQVVWSRLLILLLGNSVYGFSSMLAMYLLGIAAGSVIMSRYSSRIANPLIVFAVLETSTAILAILSLHIFVAAGVLKTDPRFLYSVVWSFEDFFQLPLISALIVLPVTLLLGAMFPVVTQLCTAGGVPASVAVGRIYGWNTVGSIFGSFFTGFVLIPLLGTFGAFLVASCMSLALGAILIYANSGAHRRHFAAFVLAVVAFLALAIQAPRDPFRTVLEARLPNNAHIVEHREDTAATVTAITYDDLHESDAETLSINGLHVSGTGFTGREMMHMPLLFTPAPKKSLIIGLGVGEAFSGSLDHHVDTTVIELLPSVKKLFPLFHRDASAYLDRPDGRVVFNDGRNFLLSSNEKYDVILVDGTPPIYASGMVNLYAYEFTELANRHLTDDGIYTLWVPIYLFDSDFWSIAKNFTDVFPRVQVWTLDYLSGMFIMGTRAATAFDVSAELIAERIAARGLDPRVRAEQIMQGIVLRDGEVRAADAKYPRITDDHPSTEFPLLRFYRGETLESSNAFLRAATNK